MSSTAGPLYRKAIIGGAESSAFFTCNRPAQGASLLRCVAHLKASSFCLFSSRCHRQLRAELLFYKNIPGSLQHPAAEASALFPLITKISEGAVQPKEAPVWILTIRELSYHNTSFRKAGEISESISRMAAGLSFNGLYSITLR